MRAPSLRALLSIRVSIRRAAGAVAAIKRFTPDSRLRLERAAVIALGLMAASCATYHDELGRGQQDFEKNDHERALAVFRALEPDQSHFDVTDEARYGYLRGMTDYRIGYRADARHWLMIAKAIEDKNPEALPADWKSRLVVTLKELNDEVYGGGISSLTNDKRRAVKDDAVKPEKKANEP